MDDNAVYLPFVVGGYLSESGCAKILLKINDPRGPVITCRVRPGGTISEILYAKIVPSLRVSETMYQYS
jgi:hypothetical protein